jgi:YD repeat-containing protein
VVEFLGSSPNRAKKIGGKLGPVHPFAARPGWRLRETASSSDGVTYNYDGRGRRVQKSEPNRATVYHYDSSGRLISETLPAPWATIGFIVATASSAFCFAQFNGHTP